MPRETLSARPVFQISQACGMKAVVVRKAAKKPIRSVVVMRVFPLDLGWSVGPMDELGEAIYIFSPRI